MEMLPTDLSFGPGSGSANVTSTAGGWDYGSINDLERCGLESSACLCSQGVGRQDMVLHRLCSQAGSLPRAASPPTHPAATCL